MMLNLGPEVVTWLTRASALHWRTFTYGYSVTDNKQQRDPGCSLAFQNSLGSCFSQGCKQILGWCPHPAGHRPLESSASGPGYLETWCPDPLLTSDTGGREGESHQGLSQAQAPESASCRETAMALAFPELSRLGLQGGQERTTELSWTVEIGATDGRSHP